MEIENPYIMIAAHEKRCSRLICFYLTPHRHASAYTRLPAGKLPQ